MIVWKPGLEAKGNVVGAPARFIVETANAGKADLDVVVLNPRGVQEKVCFRLPKIFHCYTTIMFK